jgi:YesN/AraC family two-component response regulator
MASIIVCVDDERVVLESLRSSLVAEFRGVYTIESASDGQEAMELIEELSEDGENVVMLVTDWLMPKLKGDELISKTQEIYPADVETDAELIGEQLSRAGGRTLYSSLIPQLRELLK